MDKIDPQSAEGCEQKRKSARDLLDLMYHCRIDPIRIKTTEHEPRAKGGQGVIVVATLVPAEGSVEAEPERLVAVKKIEWSREDSERSTAMFKAFVNELSLMASLSHPNVIKLLGFVEDMSKGDAWIVLPWEENGNVREFLQSGEWDIPERVSLIQDTVKGMEYLHTRQPPMCHGDLKSLNILVNSSCRAVITDFGSARIRRSGTTDDSEFDSTCQAVEASGVGLTPGTTSPKTEFDASNFEFTLTGPGFSLRWTAPEVLDDGVQDLPSDIWAMGWICWEIITCRIPFDELNTEGAIILHVVRGKMPAVREDAQLSHILKLCGLMSECWALQPVDRIDASTLQRKVRHMPSVPPSPASADGPKVRSATLLHELGTMHRLQDDRVKAESSYRAAIEVATRTKNHKAKGHALHGLGLISLAQSRYHQAETIFREAHEIHSRSGHELGIANALDGLGEVWKARFKYEEAESTLKQAREIHSRIGSDVGAANALQCLGNIYRVQCRNEEAEKAFVEAHEIQSSTGNEMGAAHALVGLGEVHCARSKYEEAAKAFTQAQLIHSRIGDDAGAANAFNALGRTYLTQSKYPEASKAFKEAHEIHRRVANNVGAANALHGLGEVYLARSKYSSAEKTLKTAHEVHSRFGSDLGAANVLDCLARVYCAQLRYQEAEKAFGDAYEIYSRIRNKMGEANALAGLGKIYRARSEYQEAERASNDAYKIYSRIGDDVGAASALYTLGEVYLAQSKYPEAEKSFKEAHEIYSRIGVQLGVANSLTGLGYTYRSQIRKQDAEQAFTDAYWIYSRIGDASGIQRTTRALGALRRDGHKQGPAEKADHQGQAVRHADEGWSVATG